MHWLLEAPSGWESAADAVYYGEIINHFKKENAGTCTSFWEAKGISKNGKLGLRNVITEESGNLLVALMGASEREIHPSLHVLPGTGKAITGTSVDKRN